MANDYNNEMWESLLKATVIKQCQLVKLPS